MNGSDSSRPAGYAWDQVERSADDDGDSNPTLASAVTSLVDWLSETWDERERILDGRVLEDLYGGRWVDGDSLSPGVSAYGRTGGDPVKLNFARNAVDFVKTKVCAETPAVMASERGSGFKAERQAKLLTAYIDRLTDSCHLMDMLPDACLSALRTGTAVVKTFSRGGMPMAELVPAEWIHIDPIEGRNGDPRSLYERRPVSRRSLIEEWCPDADPDSEPSEIEVFIRSAPPARDPLDLSASSTAESIADMVDVYEAWSLGSEERPGRHVVCVHGGCMLDEDWKLPRFAHAFFGIDPPPPGRGFWAQGLLCQLDESQAEIDFLLNQVSEQIRLGRLKVFVQLGSKVVQDQLASSRQGEMVTYDGTVPHFVTPPTVGREALEHIQWLVQELYQTIGMSESASSSQRPAGVNSGRAILFFHDFQTRRYVDLVKRYSRFTIDVVERLLDRADELHARVTEDGTAGDTGDDESEAPAPEDRLSWSKVRMDRREYNLRLETVSAVPRSYAGREQRIEQLIAQGQMPEGYWTEFLSDPNAWKAEHRAAAQAEHIEWLLERLTDPDGEMPELSDKLDLGMALEVLGGEVLTLIRKGADRETIDRVEDFYDTIVQRQKDLAAAQAEQQGAGQSQAGAPALNGAAQTPVAPGLADMGTGGLRPQ